MGLHSPIPSIIKDPPATAGGSDLVVLRRSFPRLRGLLDLDGEGPVAFVRHDDLPYLAPVVDEFVRVEELLPVPAPALVVVPPRPEDPVGGVVMLRGRRPRLDHVRVEDGQEEPHVLRVPRPRLSVDDLSNLFLDFAHAEPPPK